MAFNEKEAVAIIHEKLITNRVNLFFVEIAGFDARSLDTPYLSYSILALRQPKGCELILFPLLGILHHEVP